MGRIVDLCGEIAAAAEEGPEGLELAPEVWERLRAEWEDEDIEDAMCLVHDSLLQAELVESSDSLSARLVEILGALGDAATFKRVEQGSHPMTIEMVQALTRRVARLEDILEAFRDGSPPDRRGFEALQRRLMDLGIEKEMGEPEDADSEDGGNEARRPGRDSEDES